MRDINEHLDIVNEANQDIMSNDELLEVYNSLDKGDKVLIKINSVSNGITEREYQVKKGKTTVGKFRVERITLINPDGNAKFKYYLYQRRGNVSFAIGDMGATLLKMTKL